MISELCRCTGCEQKQGKFRPESERCAYNNEVVLLYIREVVREKGALFCYSVVFFFYCIYSIFQKKKNSSNRENKKNETYILTRKILIGKNIRQYIAHAGDNKNCKSKKKKKQERYFTREVLSAVFFLYFT